MKIYGLSLLILCFLSCGSKKQEDSVQFNVDQSLLASSYNMDSLQFSFSPPHAWEAHNSQKINHSWQQFQNEELKSYSISIKEIFYDSLSSSFCSVSLIQSTGTANLNYFVENIDALLTEQFKSENINQARFSKDGLDINQFLLMSESRVLFKLYFQPTITYIIQLDYAIDRLIYPNYIRKIESSIGSIITI